VLRYLSFGNNDAVRSESGAPSRFFGLAEMSLRVFDGLFDHVKRHVERSRKLVDKSPTDRGEPLPLRRRPPHPHRLLVISSAAQHTMRTASPSHCGAR
jgi:hypothetical protein